jgi:2-keto-4-pentenoate hydratase/2-oxohepta-3-ene-1,7-dioic acid hydratase in catechol pathway
MKLLTFSEPAATARPRLGAWSGDGTIVDLAAAHARAGGREPFPTSFKALLEGGETSLALARRAIAAASSLEGVHLAREAVRVLPPVPDAGKFLCVGKNNRSHLEELARNQLIKEIPKEPTGFIKLNSVIVGDDAAVVRPEGITTLDYEPELVFVIGKRAFRTPKTEALAHVIGITLTNDLSAREIQKREVASGTRFWTAKNMPGFGPVGPFVITLDEVDDPHDLWITCTVNGKQRMRVHTGDVIFRIGDVIEHFSRWMPFDPGDLIAMGAPAGVAVGQPNAAELYLKPGDVVEVAFEGMPPLRTRIISPSEETRS